MLELRDMRVSVGQNEIVAIDRLEIPRGRRVGLVGESGSGKTMTAMSIVGLQPPAANVGGGISFKGQDLGSASSADLAQIRGSEVGVVFQDPLRALNPTVRVGRQIDEAIRLNLDLPRAERGERILNLLDQVGLNDVRTISRRYPHQLSGGQRQRVLIAIAISCDPDLLIADEPTTALDVTVQKGVLELLVKLSEERGMALLFVSHDLGVIRAVSQEVAVLYGGRLVEFGPTVDVLGSPQHRYTQALIGANPGKVAGDWVSLLGQRLETIPGSVPGLGRFPSGCRFRNRCSFAVEDCAKEPSATHRETGHRFACWNPVGGRE